MTIPKHLNHIFYRQKYFFLKNDKKSAVRTADFVFCLFFALLGSAENIS